MNAYTAIEDLPEGQIREEARRRTLAVLLEERGRAEAEAQRYKEELGL
jgi:hypothetical protein